MQKGRKRKIKVPMSGIFCFSLIFLAIFQPMIGTEKIEACNVHRALGSSHSGYFTNTETPQIVYGGDGTLKCINALTGQQVWEFIYLDPKNNGRNMPVYSDTGPYWFWHPIKTSTDSNLYDLLIWNRTSEYRWQWEIYDGETLEKVIRIPQPNDNLGYAEVKDIDADGVEEVILDGAWYYSNGKVIFDPNREPQTLVEDPNYLVSLMGERLTYDGWSMSEMIDMNGDGQFECMRYAENGSNYEVGLFDWQNNWTLLQQFTLSNETLWGGKLDWGNYTGASTLDMTVQHGYYNEPLFIELYNQTSLVWNFTLCTRATYTYRNYPWRIDRDLDGDGISEWIFSWKDLSSADIPEGVYAQTNEPMYLSIISPKDQQVWWKTSFNLQYPYFRSHGRYHENYFDYCFGDFTGDGVEDLVLPGKERLTIINGATGDFVKEYSYPEYLIPHIQVCDINLDQHPEILLLDYFLNPTVEIGFESYMLHIIDETTDEMKSIGPPIPPKAEDLYTLGLLFAFTTGSLGFIGVFLLFLRRNK
ncbi:MAG: hypothetical protein ACFFBD_28580 [Candidatus Hodarchaeota archaeon]